MITVRLGLRQVNAHHDQIIARKNAELGLQLAMAMLQDHAGADQRITAPASTVYPSKNVALGTGAMYDDADAGFRSFAQKSNQRSYLEHAETYLVPDEREDWDEALQAWWNNNGNPRHARWTSVWDSSLRVNRAVAPFSATPPLLTRQEYESDPDTLFGEPMRRQLPVWLISGNERFRFDPATTTAYPAGYVTPDTPLEDLPDPVMLVGEGSAANAAESADGLDGRVHAPRLEVGIDGAEGITPSGWGMRVSKRISGCMIPTAKRHREVRNTATACRFPSAWAGSGSPGWMRGGWTRTIPISSKCPPPPRSDWPQRGPTTRCETPFTT
jgi:hypothetical protein